LPPSMVPWGPGLPLIPIVRAVNPVGMPRGSLGQRGMDRAGGPANRDSVSPIPNNSDGARVDYLRGSLSASAAWSDS
jgi:hypothetical protein